MRRRSNLPAAGARNERCAASRSRAQLSDTVRDMADALLIGCASCGAKNRVPQSKLGQGRKPVCGRCGAALPAAFEPIAVSDATFSSEVEGSTLPVLVDAWAPWCGPCRAVAPVVQELAAELAGRVRVAKLNVDENPVTSSRFRIQNIPTLLVFRGGREVDRLVGAQPKSEIIRRLERILD
jgi:thioredoxin 2